MKTQFYILIMVLLASCYTERKATKQANRAAVEHPAVIAEICMNRFPITPSVRIETRDSIVHDTIPGVPVIIDCGESKNVGMTLQVPCPDVPVKHHYHTITRDSSWEDTRALFLLQAKYDLLSISSQLAADSFASVIKEQDQEHSKTEHKLSKRNRQLAWLVGILALSGLLIALKFYIKINSFKL